MTEAQIRQKVVSTAKSYLGCKESDGSHRKIIDVYNGHKPLARSYKVTYKDAWCATYVSAISILCGLTDIMPTECSCSRMIELYKNLGRWKESDSYRPSIGDIMMYDWDDNGAGENTGAPEHVGIVTEVCGDTITVIEGNKSNAVGYRTMKVNGKFIRGYCLPDYANKATENEITNTAPVIASPSTTKPVVQNNKINTIKKVQEWANTKYKSGLAVDGIYGANTKKALIKIFQTELNQTYSAKLEVDGIWGNKTKAACPILKKGSKNDVVAILQAMLICNGFKDAYLDGDYGVATTTAVKAYQKKKRLIVDGIAGKNTFAKLCA